MSTFLQTLVDGSVLGSGYTLVALGFALTFSVSGVLNAAHADFYMLSAYVALVVINLYSGAQLLVALLAATAAMIVGGLVLYGAIIRRFTTAQVLPSFLATIGISVFLQYGIARLMGTQDRAFPSLVSGTFRHIGPVQISGNEALVVGATLGLTFALLRWINRSNIGRDFRAIAENEQGARILGVHVARVKATVVCVATMLAGVAGVLLSSMYGVIQPFMGLTVSVNMFIVVLVAGAGSLGGTAIAGFALGILQALTVAYVGSSWENFAGLIALVVTLIWFPSGLFGRAMRSG